MKVIYVYDAICGWCFGFSPVINKFAEVNKDKITMDVVSGGLMLGNRVGALNDVAPFIKTAYKDVERACGVKFGEKFIHEAVTNGTVILNSMPPAIAMCIMKERFPDKALAFASLLQKMVYVDGIAPEDISAYGAYAAQLGYPAGEFVDKMSNPIYTQQAIADFNYASQLGARGFPAVFLEINGKREVLCNGYTSYEHLQASFDKRVSLH